MGASGGPAFEGPPAAVGVYHASEMRSSLFHPVLRLDARTGSLRLPATIRSSNFRVRTLEARPEDRPRDSGSRCVRCREVHPTWGGGPSAVREVFDGFCY